METQVRKNYSVVAHITPEDKQAFVSLAAYMRKKKSAKPMSLPASVPVEVLGVKDTATLMGRFCSVAVK